nr:unnamed protein product [Naegleria fowleri]
MIFPGEHEKHESIWMALGPTSRENNYEYTFKKCEEDPLRYSPFHQVQLPMMEALLSGNNPEDLLLREDSKNSSYDKFYIDLIIHEEQDQDYVKNCLKKRNNINPTLIEENIRFHVIEHLDMWMRDNGPIFVVIREQGTRAIVDFGFTLWSYCKQHDEEAVIEEAVDRKVAHLLNLPVIRSHLISEGGNREFNGRDILMMVEHVEMQRNKNNHVKDRQDIEREMKRVFGESARSIVWLETEGLVEDTHAYRGFLPNHLNEHHDRLLPSMGTGGHIDEWCRFANENTILLAQVPEDSQDSLSMENRKRLEQNYVLLKQHPELSDVKILRVPVAPHIIHSISEGDGVFETLKLLDFEDGLDLKKETTPLQMIIASSYLNFLVSNRVVLISKYYREGLPESVKQLDEQVLQLFKEVYPDRNIVQIATEVLNMGGGGMHCITQQMPAL